MLTLKELRIKNGLTQPQVAQVIKSNAPFISNVENGIQNPCLEDMILLEKHFGERINWLETYSPKRKHEVVQGIIDLYQRFPVDVVSEFTARMFRREQHPDKMIQTYAGAVTTEPEPLPPTGYEIGCRECNDD